MKYTNEIGMMCKDWKPEAYSWLCDVKLLELKGRLKVILLWNLSNYFYFSCIYLKVHDHFCDISFLFFHFLWKKQKWLIWHKYTQIFQMQQEYVFRRQISERSQDLFALILPSDSSIMCSTKFKLR